MASKTITYTSLHLNDLPAATGTVSVTAYVIGAGGSNGRYGIGPGTSGAGGSVAGSFVIAAGDILRSYSGLDWNYNPKTYPNIGLGGRSGNSGSGNGGDYSYVSLNGNKILIAGGGGGSGYRVSGGVGGAGATLINNIVNGSSGDSDTVPGGVGGGLTGSSSNEYGTAAMYINAGGGGGAGYKGGGAGDGGLVGNVHYTGGGGGGSSFIDKTIITSVPTMINYNDCGGVNQGGRVELVLTGDLPGIPTINSITPGISSIAVSLTTANQGGFPVTGYAADISPPSPTAVITSTSTSVTITNLSNSIAYSFAFRALNMFGPGVPIQTGVINPSSVTVITPGNSTIIVPAGMVTATAYLWGGGGASNGGYVYGTFPVVPGNPLSLSVGGIGGSSIVKYNSINMLIAGGSGNGIGGYGGVFASDNTGNGIDPHTTNVAYGGDTATGFGGKVAAVNGNVALYGSGGGGDGYYGGTNGAGGSSYFDTSVTPYTPVYSYSEYGAAGQNGAIKLLFNNVLLPDAPQNVVAIADGYYDTLITWDPPNTPDTSYTVAVNGTAYYGSLFTFTGTTSGIFTFVGRAGDKVSFKVTAINLIGTSTSISNEVEIGLFPDQPTIVRADPMTNGVRIEFSTPSTATSASISSFIATASLSGITATTSTFTSDNGCAGVLFMYGLSSERQQITIRSISPIGRSFPSQPKWVTPYDTFITNIISSYTDVTFTLVAQANSYTITGGPCESDVPMRAGSNTIGGLTQNTSYQLTIFYFLETFTTNFTTRSANTLETITEMYSSAPSVARSHLISATSDAGKSAVLVPMLIAAATTPVLYQYLDDANITSLTMTDFDSQDLVLSLENIPGRTSGAIATPITVVRPSGTTLPPLPRSGSYFVAISSAGSPVEYKFANSSDTLTIGAGSHIFNSISTGVVNRNLQLGDTYTVTYTSSGDTTQTPLTVNYFGSGIFYIGVPFTANTVDTIAQLYSSVPTLARTALTSATSNTDKSAVLTSMLIAAANTPVLYQYLDDAGVTSLTMTETDSQTLATSLENMPGSTSGTIETPITVVRPSGTTLPPLPTSGSYFVAISSAGSPVKYTFANSSDSLTIGAGSQIFNSISTGVVDRILHLGDIYTVTHTVSGNTVQTPLTANYFGSGSFSIGLPYVGIGCFLADAPVLTPGGYRPIASIRVGDLVQTASGPVPVQVVKRFSVAASDTVNPYVIPKGRYGARQDLPISPDHKVAVGDKMIEARYLCLPRKAMTGKIEYYNLELPNYENMTVAGVIVESQYPVKRVTVTKAEFHKMLIAKYGRLTPAILERVQKNVRMLSDGMVEVPVDKRLQRK